MQVHLFLAVFVLFVAYVGEQSAFYGKTHEPAASIFAAPDDLGAGAVEAQPAIVNANRDAVFAEFYSRLFLAIEPVRRSVAAQQGSEGGPEFDPKLLACRRGVRRNAVDDGRRIQCCVPRKAVAKRCNQN